MYSVCSVVGFLAGNSGQSLGLFNPPFGNLQISASPLPSPLPFHSLLSLSLSLCALCASVFQKRITIQHLASKSGQSLGFGNVGIGWPMKKL